MSTAEKIFRYIATKGSVRPTEIADAFLLNRAMVHRHLKRLLEEGKIVKEGAAPLTFYKVATHDDMKEARADFGREERRIIDENFLFISPAGKKMEGVAGFALWCRERGFDIVKKKAEFIRVYEKYRALRKAGLLDATQKIKKTFPDACVTALYYCDFYSVEIFGKTKLGQMILYAKQSQDRQQMWEIIAAVEKKVKDVVKRKRVDAVAFVPPSVKREHQLMRFLERELRLPVPKVKVVKKRADVVVPQKTLKKLSDRVVNARESFEVVDSGAYRRVLIIDDAVGSGASINEIACKLQKRGVAQEVIGLALVGSLNDFEVISEV